MPQEFHVLRCYSCLVFQVHIVKKSNKWQCKMCNEKQSLKKVYGQGTGKDCRLHVQKLNSTFLSDTQSLPTEPVHLANQQQFHNPITDSTHQENSGASGSINVIGESRWNQYLEVKPQQTPVSAADAEEELTVLTRIKQRRGKGMSVRPRQKEHTTRKDIISPHTGMGSDDEVQGTKRMRLSDSNCEMMSNTTALQKQDFSQYDDTGTDHVEAIGHQAKDVGKIHYSDTLTNNYNFYQEQNLINLDSRLHSSLLTPKNQDRNMMVKPSVTTDNNSQRKMQPASRWSKYLDDSNETGNVCTSKECENYLNVMPKHHSPKQIQVENMLTVSKPSSSSVSNPLLANNDMCDEELDELLQL